GPRGDLGGFGDGGRRLCVELRDFVYRHIIHSFPVSRHDGHARRVLAGVFSAYRDNPRLLPDDVLRLMERELSVRFLREVPLPQIEREVAERYRPHPAFYRAIADHIAGMTDSYCIPECPQLVVEYRADRRPERIPNGLRLQPRRRDGPRPRRRGSRDRRVDSRRGPAPERRDRADRVGELGLARRARGAGFGT